MFSTHGHLVTIHLNQEGEHFNHTILDAEVHGHAINQITLLVFKHQHFGNLRERLPVHQHQILTINVSHSPQGR